MRFWLSVTHPTTTSDGLLVAYAHVRLLFLFLLDDCTSKWHYIDEHRSPWAEYAYMTRFPSAHNKVSCCHTCSKAVATALLVCKRSLAQGRPCTYHFCRLLRLLVLMDCRQLPAQVRISSGVYWQELQDPEGGGLQQEHCSRRCQWDCPHWLLQAHYDYWWWLIISHCQCNCHCWKVVSHQSASNMQPCEQDAAMQPCQLWQQFDIWNDELILCSQPIVLDGKVAIVQSQLLAWHNIKLPWVSFVCDVYLWCYWMILWVL